MLWRGGGGGVGGAEIGGPSILSMSKDDLGGGPQVSFK